MSLKTLAASAALALAAVSVSGAAVAAPVPIAHSSHTTVDRHHKCTRTSSGSCIQGGEFCPQAKYGKSGWDAEGRRYVCKGNRQHPHWEKP